VALVTCLGSPVSEMERRHRRVGRVVGVVYLGIPLVSLGIMVGMSVTGPDVAWLGCLLSAGMLVLGWLLWRRHRYQPRWWAPVGGLFAGVALLSAIHPLVTGVWFLLILALPLLAVGLPRYASRLLLVPFVPEVAETPYELAFRLRGAPQAIVLIGASTLTIQSHPVGRREDQKRTYSLTAITGVSAVSLSGAERLKFPIRMTAISTTGPAVIVQASGDDWVLPTNQSDALIDVLTRRKPH